MRNMRWLRYAECHLKHNSSSDSPTDPCLRIRNPSECLTHVKQHVGHSTLDMKPMAPHSSSEALLAKRMENIYSSYAARLVARSPRASPPKVATLSKLLPSKNFWRLPWQPTTGPSPGLKTFQGKNSKKIPQKKLLNSLQLAPPSMTFRN